MSTLDNLNYLRAPSENLAMLRKTCGLLFRQLAGLGLQMGIGIIRRHKDRAEAICMKILAIDAQLGIYRMMPSKICQKMLIVAEDRRSGRHCGIDFLAITRSICLTLVGKPHGGSTILQQLVRTLSGRYERTISRKASEIVVSYLVAKRINRSVYPRVYLAIAYYGTGLEGYDKVTNRLRLITNDEIQIAAMTVARLKYPEARNANLRNMILISRRQSFILANYERFKNTRMFNHVETVC